MKTLDELLDEFECGFTELDRQLEELFAIDQEQEDLLTIDDLEFLDRIET